MYFSRNLWQDWSSPFSFTYTSWYIGGHIAGLMCFLQLYAGIIRIFYISELITWFREIPATLLHAELNMILLMRNTFAIEYRYIMAMPLTGLIMPPRHSHLTFLSRQQRHYRIYQLRLHKGRRISNRKRELAVARFRLFTRAGAALSLQYE